MKDADCDEEQGDDNVEPVLEALQFSYEFSQVVLLPTIDAREMGITKVSEPDIGGT